MLRSFLPALALPLVFVVAVSAQEWTSWRGPARDGGFWLIGARRIRAMPRDLFADVRWSTAHALADTRANVPAAVSAGEADTLDDIDTADDLRRFRTM